MVVVAAGVASATLVESWNSNPLSTVITDGSAVGITVSHLVATDNPNTIGSVDVRLNISGGYNGDLYGYLVLQTTGGTATAILLNRVGTSGGDPFGSDGSGFNVTLSDSGSSSIHGATGNPTSVWQADQAGTLSSTFGGLTAGGTWTLFLADMSAGGGSSTLLGWGLDISVVPEPVTWALLAFATLMVVMLFRQKVAAAYRRVNRWVDAV